MDVMRQAAAAAGVLILLAAALHWLRGKRGGRVFAARRPGRRLQPVERLALGPQHTLHLVRLDGRTLLVSAGPGGCTLLETATAAPDGKDGQR